MKRTLLLMMLALGMCSINVNAQTKKPATKNTTQKEATKPIPKDSREYQVGDDGFEWYKVCKNGKWGAEDRNGNTIVPAEYDGIMYDVGCYTCVGYSPVQAGFYVRKGGHRGWYNKSGKCVIPYSRQYMYIRKYDSEDYGTYYAFTKDGGGGICDINGRVVVNVSIDNLRHIEVSQTFEGNKRYYLLFFVDNLVGIADANGKIVVTPEFEYNGHQTELENLINDRVKTTNNPLSGNHRESLADAEGTQGGQNHPIAGQPQQQSNGTTTVVVEHHRDPVPVQQWQACFACGGMGTMGCDGCGGSGTKYRGDKLVRCFRCNGQGLIPCNICYGNKGQYITVYQ